MEFNPEKQHTRLEKQKKWEEVIGLVEKTLDGEGEPIDEGIKETIVALVSLGINTAQSCEGHFESGCGAPYVDIAGRGAWALFKKADNEPDQDVENSLRKEARALNEKEIQKLIPYLEEFYGNRSVDPEVRLYVERSGAFYRLQNTGAALQKAADLETRKTKLAEFQAEIKAFTEFLKNKFFQA